VSLWLSGSLALWLSGSLSLSLSGSLSLSTSLSNSLGPLSDHLSQSVDESHRRHPGDTCLILPLPGLFNCQRRRFLRPTLKFLSCRCHHDLCGYSLHPRRCRIACSLQAHRQVCRSSHLQSSSSRKRLAAIPSTLNHTLCPTPDPPAFTTPRPARSTCEKLLRGKK